MVMSQLGDDRIPSGNGGGEETGDGGAPRSFLTRGNPAGGGGVVFFAGPRRRIAGVWDDTGVGRAPPHDKVFAAPISPRHKYDGTITNAIAFPLTSALYGVRLRQ